MSSCVITRVSTSQLYVFLFLKLHLWCSSCQAMEAAGSPSGGTSKLVRIIDCGEVKVHVEDKKKK